MLLSASYILNTWLNHERARYFLLLLGIILVLPSLAAGFFADDFNHYALINSHINIIQPDNISLFQLFTFVDQTVGRSEQLMSQSLVPWWINAEFSMVFFRPLAELSHAIDYRLLADHVWLMHLHSLLWYLALLLMLSKVYRQLFNENDSTHNHAQYGAMLALLFFVLDSTHGFTLAWLANRNAIMAAFFSLWALSGFMRFYYEARPEIKARHLLFSTVAVACAFLSGEIGICSGVLLAAYSVCYRKEPWLKRLIHLLPALAVFLIWLWVYQHYGYGASGNKAYYADMIAEPWFYLQNLFERFPLAYSMLFNVLPMHFFPMSNAVLIVFGYAIFIGLGVYCWLRKSRLLWMSFFICTVAIIPVASAEMQERNLLFNTLFSALILSDVLRQCFQRITQRSWRVLGVFLIVFHLLLSGVLLMPMSYAPALLGKSAMHHARQIHAGNDKVNEEIIISIGLSLFDAVYVAPIRLQQKLMLPKQFLHVASCQQYSIEALSERQYRIQCDAGFIADSERLLRDVNDQPIAVGDDFTVQDLNINIIALNASGVPNVIVLTVAAGVMHRLIRWETQRPQTITLNVDDIYEQWPIIVDGKHDIKWQLTRAK